MVARGRDLLTPADGNSPVELATASYRAIVSPTREILSISASPPHPGVPQLVGARAGAAVRRALSTAMEEQRGQLLYQLLDDYAGASLVAGWIWSRWTNDWMRQADRASISQGAGRGGNMLNVCAGFAEGASSLIENGRPDIVNQSSADVGPLENPDDALGWHAMPVQQGPQKRRARRIDVWLEDGMIKVDAGFQDSGSNPNGGRTAIHEYRAYAEIDRVTHRLMALQVLPLILPYRECPGASVKATRMIGANVVDFRSSVLETLPSTQGCTHLNDMLRALADVPALAEHLARA